MEQKQAIQMRKMEEELKNLQEFERLREAAIKPNDLLEEISGKPGKILFEFITLTRFPSNQA
jgi:hypothetical protein